METNGLIMHAPETPSAHIRQKINKVALIDADFIKYLVCSDISSYIKREGHHPSEKYGDIYLDRFVNDQLEKQFFNRWDCWGNIFFFSGNSKDTFRYKVGFTKEYKGNRGTTEPAYENFYEDLAGVIGVVSKKNNVYIHPEYEADDLVCALQNEHTFIYSRDKDLKQVVGNHYDYQKNQLHNVSESDALYFLAVQLLEGDTTDNIPGIQGIGNKTANKYYDGVATNNLIQKAFECYINKYGYVEGADRFAETWMLVKMRFNRGGYEAEKFKPAYYLRDTLIKNKL